MLTKLRKGRVYAGKEVDLVWGLAFIFGISLNTKCPLTFGLSRYVETIAPDRRFFGSVSPSKMFPRPSTPPSDP